LIVAFYRKTPRADYFLFEFITISLYSFDQFTKREKNSIAIPQPGGSPVWKKPCFAYQNRAFLLQGLEEERRRKKDGRWKKKAGSIESKEILRPIY
jgi:hypothetical protein